jgi:hypothetical protein
MATYRLATAEEIASVLEQIKANSDWNAVFAFCDKIYGEGLAWTAKLVVECVDGDFWRLCWIKACDINGTKLEIDFNQPYWQEYDGLYGGTRAEAVERYKVREAQECRERTAMTANNDWHNKREARTFTAEDIKINENTLKRIAHEAVFQVAGDELPELDCDLSDPTAREFDRVLAPSGQIILLYVQQEES